MKEITMREIKDKFNLMERLLLAVIDQIHNLRGEVMAPTERALLLLWGSLNWCYHLLVETSYEMESLVAHHREEAEQLRSLVDSLRAKEQERRTVFPLTDAAKLVACGFYRFHTHDPKIEAIKILRNETGLGLADAKNSVEHWMSQKEEVEQYLALVTGFANLVATRAARDQGGIPESKSERPAFEQFEQFIGQWITRPQEWRMSANAWSGSKVK